MTYKDYASAIPQELSKALNMVSEEEINNFVETICKAKRIFVAGAGRSGLMIKGFAMRLMHLGLESYVVSEMVTPSFSEGDLLVIGSGSGETGSLVTMANKAKKLGGKIALLTIMNESTIGKLADDIVKIPGVTQKSEFENTITSIQPMANCFEQSMLLILDIVSILLMERFNMTTDEMFKNHANLE